MTRFRTPVFAAFLGFLAAAAVFTQPVPMTQPAFAGPVPIDPVPYDPECYNGCWQNLQQALDEAQDLRDQAQVHLTNAQTLAQLAQGALDALHACMQNPPTSGCSQQLQDYILLSQGAIDELNMYTDLTNQADMLEDQAYDDYQDCIDGCGGGGPE